jgi:hypothetical protein
MQITVRLADPASKLPLPNAAGAFAPEGDFTIDLANPYWAQAYADGSVIAPPAKASAASPTGNPIVSARTKPQE